MWPIIWLPSQVLFIRVYGFFYKRSIRSEMQGGSIHVDLSLYNYTATCCIHGWLRFNRGIFFNTSLVPQHKDCWSTPILSVNMLAAKAQFSGCWTSPRLRLYDPESYLILQWSDWKRGLPGTVTIIRKPQRMKAAKRIFSKSEHHTDDWFSLSVIGFRLEIVVSESKIFELMTSNCVELEHWLTSNLNFQSTSEKTNFLVSCSQHKIRTLAVRTSSIAIYWSKNVASMLSRITHSKVQSSDIEMTATEPKRTESTNWRRQFSERLYKCIWNQTALEYGILSEWPLNTRRSIGDSRAVKFNSSWATPQLSCV